jgi:dihydroorotate dehydrogenase electron transfer subunit
MGESRPLAPFGRRLLQVTDVRELGAYTGVTLLDEQAPTAQPGQFHMLSLESGWGGEADERPWLGRAISFFANDPDGLFEFLIDPVGPGTRLLSEVRPNDRIWVTGPFGNGFSTAEAGRRPVLIGGGIGAAPILALAALPTRPCSAFELRSTLRSRLV